MIRRAHFFALAALACAGLAAPRASAAPPPNPAAPAPAQPKSAEPAPVRPTPSQSASAEPDSPSEKKKETPASSPAKEAPESPKRRAPDYDGREDPPTTAGDVLLWVPRVIFFPAYVVTEYVVRKPLGFLVTTAERGRWVQELTNFFTFGPNNNIGIVPSALIDFGVRPSIGLYFFYDDLGFKGNGLRVHAATGGENWYRLTVADKIAVDDRSYVKIRGEGWVRPDWIFAGIGPESLEKDQSRYLATSFEGGFSFHGEFLRSSSIELYTDVKTISFGEDTCCDDPTLQSRVAQGAFELPPGFTEGYTANHLGLRLGLDSRSPRPAPGSGVRLDLMAEHGFDVTDAKRRWLRYGAAARGYVDLTGHQRVLSLSVSTVFSDPLDEKEVPFTELIRLGGAGLMRGFREDRLIGKSAAVATLEYRYPIWAFLDGALDVSLGNVFSEHLRDFSPDLLRLSWTAGVRTVGVEGQSFDLLIGSGTETFKQGAALQELRFLLGAQRAF